MNKKMQEGNLEFKFKTLNEKSSDGLESVIIEGYASVNTKDRDGDVVIQYGIDMANFEKNPIILYQHDRGQPAGKVLASEITDKGLYVKAEVIKEVNPQAYYAVKSGVVTMFSIGFRGLDGEYNEETDTFYFTKTELLEISLVSIPANQDAKFEVVETPCGNGFCLANKGYKPEDKQKSEKQINQVQGDEVSEELIKSLLQTNEAILAHLKELSEKKEEAKEEKKEASEVEEKKEEKAEVEVKEEKKELEVTEENFNELLSYHKELGDKLNKFVAENI